MGFEFLLSGLAAELRLSYLLPSQAHTEKNLQLLWLECVSQCGYHRTSEGPTPLPHKELIHCHHFNKNHILTPLLFFLSLLWDKIFNMAHNLIQ